VSQIVFAHSVVIRFAYIAALPDAIAAGMMALSPTGSHMEPARTCTEGVAERSQGVDGRAGIVSGRLNGAQVMVRGMLGTCSHSCLVERFKKSDSLGVTCIEGAARKMTTRNKDRFSGLPTVRSTERSSRVQHPCESDNRNVATFWRHQNYSSASSRSAQPSTPVF
jgi:hypothetical protein